MRQSAQPLPEQRVDLFGRQRLAQRLRPRGCRAGEHSVVQRLVVNALVLQLPLEPFVPVDAQLRVVGKVAAELQEERAEIPVHTVHVEVVDHRRGTHQPEVACPSIRVVPAFGAKHRRLLLRLADEQHPFLRREFLQETRSHVVLALALAKRHHGNLVLLGKALHRLHKALADRVHQHAGGSPMTTVETKESGCPRFSLQARHVNIQIHPVDSLKLQAHVLGQNLGNTWWYAHIRFRLAPVLRDQMPTVSHRGHRVHREKSLGCLSYANNPTGEHV